MNEIIQHKLDVLQIYIDAVKKENYEQTMLWTADEFIDSPAFKSIIEKLNKSDIKYRLIKNGFIIYK